MSFHPCRWIAWALLALLAGPAAAQQAAVRYTTTEAMIPMRDGVRLHTRVLAPADAAGPLPVILRRTPYGAEGSSAEITGSLRELADERYIFVFQDIRGRYRSEGSFAMIRPARARGDARAIDEASDTYDTIEWILRNVPGNNGRVGMLGISYDGWLTTMAVMDPHPALRAASPQASVGDMWMGDDFYHNGAFRLSIGYEYTAMMETSRELTPDTFFNRYDTYDWYLRLGPLSNVNAKHFHGRMPTWNDLSAHPAYDEFWQRRAVRTPAAPLRVPTLHVGGWWDQEDFYGSVAVYQALERADTAGINFLVLGPWYHGSWGNRGGEKIGKIGFGSPTSDWFRQQVQAPWFAYWLKGRGRLDQPEALTFEAGSNQWRRWTSWPPPSLSAQRAVYLDADGRLSFEPPAPSADSVDTFISDPAHPVPFRQRPIQATYFPHGSGWYTWLLEDQRFVGGRPDVLSWESEPLENDLTIAGEIEAHLFAATTGTDADWYVKLIDVYPESYPQDWSLAGYQLMVSNEIFRGRYFQSFERPAPLPAGGVVPYRIGLHTQNYTFRKGHRIMVQVQSTAFPLYDRNPQTFVPNIFQARAADFRAQTHTVFRTPRYPSRVTLPVVSRPAP
ncbi:MAG TPA: CocE/NonD family hydrolase [Longimicrobium sp.]|jgi:hypothetical protein